MTIAKSIVLMGMWLLVGTYMSLSTAHADDGNDNNNAYYKGLVSTCLNQFEIYQKLHENTVRDRALLTVEVEELRERRAQFRSDAFRLSREASEVTNCNTRDPDCMARIHAHDEIRAVHNEKVSELRKEEQDLEARLDSFNERLEQTIEFGEKAVASCRNWFISYASEEILREECRNYRIDRAFFEERVERDFFCHGL